MSKLNVGVGEEFPLDEAANPDRHHHHRCGPRGRWRHHDMHHHHGHGHHGRRRVWRLPFLLLAIGLIALIVQQKLPVEAAYGLIALGATLMAVKLIWHLIGHWREHRRMVSP